MLRKITKIWFLIVLFIMFTQCSIFNQKEKDKTAENFLLFSLLQQNLCNLGGQDFIINGNITCTNNEASGTGTLIATTEKSVVSLQVTMTLNADDSEIKIIGGANDSLNGSGFLFRNNEAKAFHPDGTAGGVDMTTGFSFSSGPKTHCFEIHTGETPPHLVAWENTCPSPQQTSADYNSETYNPGGTSAKYGLRWGFILNNAKISISINDDEIFIH